MTPLEPPNAKTPRNTQGPSGQSQWKELPVVDQSGLTRAIALLENGVLQKDAIVSLLKHEFALVEKQVDNLCTFAQNTLVELRQLREAKEQNPIEHDGARTIQDGNDQFVAQLIAEHESQVQTLRRERDAAVDRIRELSRGLSRVGGISSPSSLRRPSLPGLSAASTGDNELVSLRARIDELLFERERSLKLLRQLAEQRDQAESRLQIVISSAPPGPTPPQPSNLPVAISKTPTVSVTGQDLMSASSPVTANPVPHAVDSGLDWDLSNPEKHPVSVTPSIALAHANATPQEEAHPPAQATETTLPLLRKKVNIRDGAGAYHISAKELPVEEVVVVRSRPSNPRPGR